MRAELILLITIMLIVFLYGIVIGSFLNVLIYRIPLKENIAIQRSHCMTCGYQLKWYDLVPLLSYMVLRGRCRKCKAKISIQYPLVELTNGLGYVLIVSSTGLNLLSILFCLCFSILIVISIIDIRTYEIPFSLNVAIGILGIIRCILDYTHLLDYIIGFCAVSGFLLLLAILTKGRGMGGGDIKLMAAAGLLLGWKNIVLALALGSIVASVFHITLMSVKKSKERVLAFGPYLSIGIFIAMLYGERIISWYLNFFK